MSTLPAGKPAEAIVAIQPGAGRPMSRAMDLARRLRERTIQPAIISGIVFLNELVAVILAGWLTVSLWVGATSDHGPYGLAIVSGAIVLVLGLQSSGAYSVESLRRYTTRLGRVVAVWTMAAAAVTLTLFVTGVVDGMARAWFPAWYAAVAALLVATTLTSAMAVRSLTREGRLQRRAVIVGGGPSAEALIKAIRSTAGNEVRILGIFDDRTDERSPESQAGYPKLGNLDELIAFARVAAIDLLIVSIPMSAETRLLQMLKKLWVLPVDIRLSAHASKLRLRPRSYSYVGSVPFLDLFDRPISGWDSIVKRAFDVLFASLGIVAFSPVMLATALAVRLDSKGPILFRQKRYGFNNEVISVLKFRSMYQDMADPAARKVVTKGDPRVTPSAASSARLRSTNCPSSSTC